jgi:hypothetical protein
LREFRNRQASPQKAVKLQQSQIFKQAIHSKRDIQRKDLAYYFAGFAILKKEGYGGKRQTKINARNHTNVPFSNVCVTSSFHTYLLSQNTYVPLRNTSVTSSKNKNSCPSYGTAA